MKTADEKEEFLGEQREYLSEPKNMEEVVQVLKFVTGPLHQQMLSTYADEPNNANLLSMGDLFITALMAAAGKYADMSDQDSLMAALQRLLADIKKADPLDLDTYWEVYRAMTAGKGRKIRSTICAAFVDYFRATSKTLPWAECAKVYE